MHRVIPRYQRLQINKVIVAALLSGLPVVANIRRTNCRRYAPKFTAQLWMP